MDQLLRINIEGVPLSEWDSSGALQLWWEDKSRRVNQKVSTHLVEDENPAEDESQPAASTPPPVGVSLFDEWEQWITADADN